MNWRVPYLSLALQIGNTIYQTEEAGNPASSVGTIGLEPMTFAM